jgi:hypothetical protein
VRRHAGALFHRQALVSQMVEKIKELIDADDPGGDT